jgi:hypothetical protein
MPKVKNSRDCTVDAVLLDALKSMPSVTTLYARQTLGIPHPAGCIKRFRDAGLIITTYRKTELDSCGIRHNVAEYVLEVAP